MQQPTWCVDADPVTRPGQSYAVTGVSIKFKPQTNRLGEPRTQVLRVALNPRLQFTRPRSKLAFPFQLHFQHRERAIELMASVYQVDRVVTLDDAKPDGDLTAQSLRFNNKCPNHSRVEWRHVPVLLGSMPSINAAKLIDL